MSAADVASSRSRILDAALALMSEHGAAATSMRMLANASGLNVATLYHHFPSKADLLTAVLAERAYEELLATSEPPAQVTSDPDPRVRLRRLLRWLWWAAEQEDAVLRLLLGESLRGEPAAGEAAAGLVDAIDVAARRWLGASVPELAARGPAVAGVVRSLLLGLITEHVALGPDGARVRRRIDDAVAALLPAR